MIRIKVMQSVFDVRKRDICFLYSSAENQKIFIAKQILKFQFKNYFKTPNPNQCKSTGLLFMTRLELHVLFDIFMYCNLILFNFATFYLLNEALKLGFLIPFIDTLY